MPNQNISGSFTIPFRLVFLMWLAFSAQFFLHIDLSFLGIKPRSFYGLMGILTAPLIHANYTHLISNTFPILFLGALLFFFYNRIGRLVFIRCYFITNILVWIFSSRESYHVGASGVVYGLAFFLILLGLLRRDFISLLISIIVILAYGSIFYGILPMDPRISWESHLSGALVGVATAIDMSGKNKVR